MTLLIAGIVLSLFGSVPPGLISLTVAQTALSRGFRAAMALATGAAFAEFFQAWAASGLSDWFLSHPNALRMFHWAAVPVFFLLGIHLIFFAKPPNKPLDAESTNLNGQFFKGVVLSVFNLLAVPYWFVYCGWLHVEGWWQEGLAYTLVFSLGVSIGTVGALSLYAWLGQFALRQSSHVAKYANWVIGLIFLGLGAKALWDSI